MGKPRRRDKVMAGFGIMGALMGPVGGHHSTIQKAESGYGRNVGNYSRDVERNRRGDAARNGTNDRNNRRRGTNRRD